MLCSDGSTDISLIQFRASLGQRLFRYRPTVSEYRAERTKLPPMSYSCSQDVCSHNSRLYPSRFQHPARDVLHSCQNTRPGIKYFVVSLLWSRITDQPWMYASFRLRPRGVSRILSVSIELWVQYLTSFPFIFSPAFLGYLWSSGTFVT